MHFEYLGQDSFMAQGQGERQGLDTDSSSSPGAGLGWGSQNRPGQLG